MSAGRKRHLARASALGILLALALGARAAGAEHLPIGYQARACGFDLNDDGVIGDPAADCDVCDGVTVDPDHDGVAEDLIYIDSQGGSDLAGDGSPQSPYATIQYAWNQADGPGDGAEDILCFTGTAAEEEIVAATAGVPGVRTLPRSGNEAVAWEFPTDPAMLVGWDTDNDGAYPPVDPDDVAVLDGGGNHLDTGLSRALRVGAGNSYLEIAHFTARDYGRYYPVILDGNGHVVDAREAGFVRFTNDQAGVASHIVMHDLWLENINRDTVGGSHRITFDFFVGRTVLHHLAFLNLKITDTSSFLARGAAPDLPGQGQGGRDFGPVRWQNLSVTVRGKDEAPGTLGGFFQGWKLWGYMTGLEILDSVVDARHDQWNAGSASVDFVNATQCSRNWTIRNNLLLGVREALTAQGGNGAFCAHDTVNVPPTSIPRTTDNVVFADNIYLNDHEHESDPVLIKGGDDPQRSVENVVISNNLFVTTAAAGFGWCIKAAAANDTGPGNPGRTVVANNTCYGRVVDAADRGGIVIGDVSRPAIGQQADVLVKNNIVSGFGDGPGLNVEMHFLPASLQMDANVYDSAGSFAGPGFTASTLAAWRSGSGFDALSATCSPAFVDADAGDLRLQPWDVCAKNAGEDLSERIPATDLHGTLRPQQLVWDVGAYEALEPEVDAPPLRYGGSPAGSLPHGSTQAAISLATYRPATCRYATAAGTPYAAMPGSFSSGDGTRHQTVLGGLADGGSYEVFVRCLDGGNGNDDDYRISFSVDSAPVTTLVAHWAMNENVGVVADDSSAGGNHASLWNGATWIEGRVGAALQLDGTNDFLTVPRLAGSWPASVGRSLTIAAWVRPTSSGGQKKIFSKDNVVEMQVGRTGSGRYGLRLNNTSAGAGATPIVAGSWQHLAATWDGTTVRYYYNGHEDGSFAYGGTLATNTNSVGIGARPPGSDYFDGALDEVRLYDGALSAAEILALAVNTMAPPDNLPPRRGDAFPAAALASGTTSGLVGLRTGKPASCRHAPSPGVPYASMTEGFATSDGFTHTTTLVGLADGESRTLHVRCIDLSGNANGDDFLLPVTVLAPTPAVFRPEDLPDLRFFLLSTSFEDPSTYARSIARCATEACLVAGPLAAIEQQYCDLGRFPDGCIRRWDDLSGYLPAGGFRPPEWIRGRNFGQDDAEKPGFVPDCIHGHPCARGGGGAQRPDGSTLPQNFSFEVEIGQTMSLPGEFSIFLLARPVLQASDYQYFGLNGLIHRVADDSLAYRTSAGTQRITAAGAITNGVWQLIEIHRAASGAFRVFVNGVDVTLNTPVLGGGAAGSNYLSAFKGSLPMFGDMAATLTFARALGDQERLDVRTYLDRLYAFLPLPEVPACPLVPSTTCRNPVEAKKSSLKIVSAGGDRDKLMWKWTSATGTSREDIGSPASGDGFHFCLYDSVAGAGRLRLDRAIAGASSCSGGRACWKETAGGASYRDSRLVHGGIRKLSLAAGAEGRARITLSGKGPLLGLPPLPLSVEPWLRVQLHNFASGQCWEATYSVVDVRGTERLRAVSD